MEHVRQLDYQAMWTQLEDDLRKAIENPPGNVSKKTQEVAITVFYNVLDNMNVITQDYELKRIKELEDKYAE